MTRTAQVVTGGLEIAESWMLHYNVHGLTVDCSNSDEFDALPALVVFEERTYGKSGWDSDKFRAYYRTDRKHAVAK